MLMAIAAESWDLKHGKKKQEKAGIWWYLLWLLYVPYLAHASFYAWTIPGEPTLPIVRASSPAPMF